MSDIRALAKELLASATEKYRENGLCVETLTGTYGDSELVAFRVTGRDPDGWMPSDDRWKAIAFAPDGTGRKIASVNGKKHTVRFAKSQPTLPNLRERERWPEMIKAAGLNVKLWKITAATVTEVVHGDRDVPELRA